MTQPLAYRRPPARTARVGRRMVYFFGALGALIWGYDTGVVAGALLYIKPEFHLSPTETGLVGSFLAVGSALGAVISAVLVNRLGRKRLIFIAALVFLLGIALAVLSTGAASLIIARGVLGMGIGIVAVSIPVYLAEISPAASRGGIGALTQLMIAVGILLGYIGNLALSSSGNWRAMFAVMAVPTVALGVGVWALPESPRWLLRQGRPEEARQLLENQVGAGEVETTMREMQESMSSRRVSFWHAFRGRLRRIVVIAIALETLTQLLGINTIVYYAPTILKTIGFSDSAALINTVGFGVLSVIFTVLAARVIDRWGRKPLMSIGALVMGAAMLVMAGLLWRADFTVGAGGFLAIGALSVFKATFSLTWGTATRVVVSELLPTSIRGSMQGFAQIFNYAATFVLTLVFPILLEAGSSLAFLFFAVMGLIAFLVMTFLVPETKGQTLEEIEAMVTEGPWSSRHPAHAVNG